jgi:fatty acid desaturase
MTATAHDASRSAAAGLGARRNGPGLVHLGAQLAVLAAASVATVQLAAAGHPGWIAAVTLTGVVIVTFFPTLHEAGHQTAFASAGLNELAVWLGALLMLQCPSFFREFHWEHHRATQDPALDPEIRAAPRLVDDWPGNPLAWALLASGLHLLLGKPAFTLACGFTPRRVWVPLFPYLRPAQRRRIAWESRATVLGLAGGVAAGLTWIPGFAPLLLAWPISHLLLGLYLMPEHTGLPHSGTQLERTRTVESNAIVRWLMWNMPYHAEHHAHPGVPFHAVPVLHERLRGELVAVHRSYTAFHLEALRRSVGLCPTTE